MVVWLMKLILCISDLTVVCDDTDVVRPGYMIYTLS